MYCSNISTHTAQAGLGSPAGARGIILIQGTFVCVCVFITAVPIIKLFAWGQGDSGEHVLRRTTGYCGLQPDSPELLALALLMIIGPGPGPIPRGIIIIRGWWTSGGSVLHQPPWSFGFDSQMRGTTRTLCQSTGILTGPNPRTAL
jgi:hypothetical protein